MPKKILIVDDEREVREQLSFALRSRKYMTLSVEDAEHGIFAFTAEPEIALIVLDWELPVMSGGDFLRYLQANLPTVPPSIILGNCADYAEVRAAFALGAKDYLLKPVDKEIFGNKVDALLKIGEAPHRETYRHEVNFMATSQLTIKNCDAKTLILENAFAVRVGEQLSFLSAGFSQYTNLPFNQRYTCRVRECEPQGEVFRLVAEILGISINI